MKKVFIIVSAVILLSGLLFAGCSTNAQGTTLSKTVPTQSGTTTSKAVTPQFGGTLRVADTFGVTNFGYPPKLVGAGNQRAGDPAIERLFYFDKNGEVQPWLAADSKTDVSAKTITFTLKKGIKFQDGTVFDAEAVKWNLEQCMAAKTAGVQQIKSVDAVDSNTVRINLSVWDNTVMGSLAGIPGMMISPTAYKTNGEKWCNTQPVGTGPFKLVSYTQDVSAIYKKWDGYWQQGKPYLDEVDINYIQDNLTRAMSFRNKEQDVLVTTDIGSTADLIKDGFTVLKSNQQGGIGAVFSSAVQDSPFSNLKVRQAASYAIDSQAIVDTVLRNVYEVTNQMTYKGNWGYNPSVVGYPYNVTKAKQLLTEAGYANGFNTEISYITTPMYDQVFTAVQGYYKAIGINLQLKANTPAALGQIRSTGWNGLTFTGGGNFPDLALWLVNRYLNTYASMLQPSDYVAAVNNAISATDFATKQKYTQEVERLMFDQYCLVLPISTTMDFCAIQSYVNNVGLIESSADSTYWPVGNTWLKK